MKKLFTALLSVCFLGLALTVLAADPDQGRSSCRVPATQPGPAPHPPMFGPHLSLSASQRDKLIELEARYFQETRDLRYEAAQKRLEMRKLFTDPKADEPALLAKHKELSAVEQRLHEKRGQMKIEGRKILTAAQLRELDRAPLDQPRVGPPGMGACMAPPPPPPADHEKGKGAPPGAR